MADNWSPEQFWVGTSEAATISGCGRVMGKAPVCWLNMAQPPIYAIGG